MVEPCHILYDIEWNLKLQEMNGQLSEFVRHAIHPPAGERQASLPVQLSRYHDRLRSNCDEGVDSGGLMNAPERRLDSSHEILSCGWSKTPIPVARSELDQLNGALLRVKFPSKQAAGGKSALLSGSPTHTRTPNAYLM